MLTTSPTSRLKDLAVRGLSSAALSQVSLVIGSGSSCSQPLLAKRPSYTLVSGTNSSSSCPPRGRLTACSLGLAGLMAGVIGLIAVSGTTPLCSALRQAFSAGLRLARTTSVGPTGWPAGLGAVPCARIAGSDGVPPHLVSQKFLTMSCAFWSL